MAYNALSFVWNVNEEAKVSVGLGGVTVPGKGLRGPRVVLSTVMSLRGVVAVMGITGRQAGLHPALLL